MPIKPQETQVATVFLRLIKSCVGFMLPMVLWSLAGTVLFNVIKSAELFLILNAKRALWADYFFTATDLLGEGYGQLILAVLFFFTGKRYWALLLAITYSFSGLVSQFLKKVVFTEALRPVAYFREYGITPQTMPWVQMREYNSFPSGHTITCFSLFCCLAFFYRKPVIGFIFFLAAVVSSYSRIYAGQHFPIDVYAGAIIGVLCNLIVMFVFIRFFPKIYHRFELQ
jgi:membrane-associated phospholipid phosphatase